MRLQQFLYGGLALAVTILSVSASSSENAVDPDVVAVASFPENNPFGHVVNGEKNKIALKIQNQSGRNITITSISGSFHHPDTNIVIKNTTSAPYDVGLIEGAKTTLPYTFYSEFKPGDLRLNIWVNHVVDGETYRVLAYDSVVTIVEPEASIFDIQLIITYFIVGALFAGLVYFAYLIFVPQPSKKFKKRIAVSTSDPASATVSGYQEEWIPEHHLSKKGKKKVLTSGDELSGGETSGAEARKRKGKK